MFIDLKIFSIILDVSAIFKLDAKTTFLEIFLYRALPSNLQFNEYPEYIFGVLYKSYFKVLSLIFSSGLIRSGEYTRKKSLDKLNFLFIRKLLNSSLLFLDKLCFPVKLIDLFFRKRSLF